MAFSDAFARGYAVGDSIKKRRATAKFFEKFKELSAEEEDELVTEDGQAIPVQPAVPATTPEPVAQAAIPMDGVGGAEEDPAEVAGMPRAAPSGVGVPEPAPAAIPVGSTAAPAPTEPKPAKGKKAPKTSLSRDNIKELDDLAMEAARASGDAEVYTALQRTTESFLQKKVLSNLSLAQTAIDNGDVDATEKYLKRAYRFVPDGQEVNFKRKDGQLYIKDPWDSKNEIMLGSEQIGYLATRIMDPQKWSEIVRGERKERQAAAMEERRTKVAERGAAAEEARVEISRGQLDVAREQIGISREELGLKNRELTLKELMAPIERLETYQRVDYYAALAEAAKLNAKGGGKDSLDVTMDDAREMAREVDGQFRQYTAPPTDPVTGEPVSNWEAPDDVAGLSPKDIQTANGLAQAIGARNAGRVPPAMAVQAGLALARAGAGGGEVEILADKGLMLFDYNGVQTPVMLPSAVIEGLVQQEQARQRAYAAGAGAGIPSMPAPAANPVAPPVRPW